MEKIRVGIDIGGTKVNIGLVSQNGTILCNTVLPSTGAHDIKAFTDSICTAVETLLDNMKLDWEAV